MKIQKSTHKKTRAVLICVVALLLIAGGVIAYMHLNRTPEQAANVNYDSPTQEEIKTGQDIKDQSLGSSDDKNQASTDKPNAPVAQTDGKPTIDVSFTSTNQINDSLVVRTLIGAVTSQGTCNLALQNGMKTVTKTADVQALSSSSTCQGFTIPLSELASGQWSLNLTYSGETTQGTAVTTVVIR